MQFLAGLRNRVPDRLGPALPTESWLSVGRREPEQGIGTLSKGERTEMSGTFVLSLDTEQAWGSFDKGLSPELVRAAEWENREGIPRLLDLLCRHRISATWAFVGHATLDHCSGHPE